ncbi:MAG: SMC-Scp complex subunit ScpB [Actinomycetaceae bacterium]|nr:SMC-Scp complex subunit ScpB [Actinomycetaceae bacterium]
MGLELEATQEYLDKGAGAPSAALEGDELVTALEALLIVAQNPVPTAQLAEVTGAEESQVFQCLSELAQEYRATKGGRPRGFVLRKVAGGWRFYTNPDCDEVLERFVAETYSSRLSQAALETLSIVAYKQPCTRAQVGAIRGVNVDSVMRNLAARGLIEEVGTQASGAGLYATTVLFLETLGIQSLDDLAPLAPFLPAVANFAQNED